MPLRRMRRGGLIRWGYLPRLVDVIILVLVSQQLVCDTILILKEKSIKKEQVIVVKDQNLVFAVTEKQMKNMRSKPDIERFLGIGRGRGAHYVEFDACPGEFTPRKNSRNPKLIEYVHKGSLDLSGRNPTFE